MNAANIHADATPTAAPTPLTNAAPACIIFLVGRGGGGKTHLLRYLVERAFAAGGSIVIADGDRTNRTLPLYFDGVLVPPGADDRLIRPWLEQIIERVISSRFNLVVDLGGGDMVLKHLALELDLLAMLEQHAVCVVMLHLIGPEVESLGYLASMEAQAPWGKPLFAPERTALILNEGLIGDGLDAGEAFAPVREHKLFRAALQRRAEVVLMPGAHHKPWSTGAVTAGGDSTPTGLLPASSASALEVGWNSGHRRRKAFSSSPLSTRVRAVGS